MILASLSASELTFCQPHEYCGSFVVIWYRIAATLNKQLKGRRAKAMTSTFSG